MRFLVLLALLLCLQSHGFPNQAGSCDTSSIIASSHGSSGPTELPDISLRINRDIVLRQNTERRLDITTTQPLFLELFSTENAFKGALIRVEQVYLESTSSIETTTTTPSLFEFTAQSRNAQNSNFCNNDHLVQAISHKDPFPKYSMIGTLQLDEKMRIMILAIDVNIVVANNSTAGSIYATQTYRLRLEQNTGTTTPPPPPPTMEQAPNNNDDDDDTPSTPTRLYPSFVDTTSCQLCPSTDQELRYPNDTVRWTNGTEVSCQQLRGLSCRTAQALVQDDGGCGGCRRICKSPCAGGRISSLSRSIPMLGRDDIPCALLEREGLDRLLAIRTCAVSQALVLAHCGCQDEDVVAISAAEGKRSLVQVFVGSFVLSVVCAVI